MAEALHGTGVSVARIDGSVHRGISDKLDVKGFPSIYFIKDGMMRRYGGERTLDAFKSYAEGGWEDDDSPVSQLESLTWLEAAMGYIKSFETSIDAYFKGNPGTLAGVVLGYSLAIGGMSFFMGWTTRGLTYDEKVRRKFIEDLYEKERIRRSNAAASAATVVAEVAQPTDNVGDGCGLRNRQSRTSNE